MNTKKERANTLIRNNLPAMIRKSFETSNEGTKFSPNWHIDAMAYALEECFWGDTKRLIVTIPPRSLKSEICSVAFAAWVLGNDPTRRIINVSYSDDLAKYFSRVRKKIFESCWYAEVFPKMKIGKGKNTESEIVTTRGGGCYATSVGGTLTGRGGNFLIIDDPQKPDGSSSQAERTAVNDWYQNTLYSRLNNKEEDVIIIVMQRTHMNDLVGHVLELDDWTVLNLPAIAEEEVKIKTGPNESNYYTRKLGEPLHPDRESLATLEKIKNTLGSYVFSSQYQQAPVPLEGNLVRREWLSRFDGMLETHQFKKIVQSWDTATGKEVNLNFSVCTTWGIRPDGCYLLHLFRDRLEFPELLKAIYQQAELYKPSKILIEDASSGRSIIQSISEHKDLPIEAIKKPSTDKETRLAQASAEFERKRVFFPKEASWLADLENELLSFPGSAHSDQVDSISQFLLWHLDPQQGGYKPAIANRRSIVTKNGRYTSKSNRKPHPQRNPNSPRTRKY